MSETTPDTKRVWTPRRMILLAAMASLGLLNAGCLQAIQGAFRIAGEVLNGVGEIAEPVMGAIDAFRNGDVAGGVGNILGATGRLGNVVGGVGRAVGELVENRPRAQEAGPVRAGEGMGPPTAARFVPDQPAIALDANKVMTDFRNATTGVQPPLAAAPATAAPRLTMPAFDVSTPQVMNAPDGTRVELKPIGPAQLDLSRNAGS